MNAFIGKAVEVFSLISIKSRFGLELKGLKGRGQTMFSLVKERYGLKGNRQSVYEQFCQYVEQQKQLLQSGEIQ